MYGTLLILYMIIKSQCCSSGCQQISSQLKSSSNTADKNVVPTSNQKQLKKLNMSKEQNKPESNFSPLLQKLTIENNDEKLLGAIEKAGRTKCIEAIPYLGALLIHNNPAISKAAAQNLGQIGDPAALKFLFSSTEKLDSEIREFKKSTIKMTENRSSSVNTIKKTNFTVNTGEQENKALKNTAPLDKILEPLKEKNYKILDRHTPHALAKLNEDQIIDLLLKVAGSEEEPTSNRYHAIKNLSYFYRKNLAKDTAAFFKTSQPALRFAAADTIARIGGREASIELINALNDENSYVRSAAASGLATLGNDKSLAPLLKLKDDNDEFVKFSAQRALDSLSKNMDIAPLIKQLIKQ